MAAELLFVRGTGSSTVSWEQACTRNNKYKSQTHLRASHSTDKQNKVYKQLGLFSLKRKIEDAVLRAEMLAPPALELEEARRIKQEEMIHDHDLWDDPAKSNEILIKLADSEKVVDALKDLQYKAEEAKLISQLAEMDAINYGLFKQAYDASLDVSKLLDQYEMSKLLRGPYDIEGACVTIKAGSEGVCPEVLSSCSALEFILNGSVNAFFKKKSDVASRFRSFMSSVLFGKEVEMNNLAVRTLI